MFSKHTRQYLFQNIHDQLYFKTYQIILQNVADCHCVLMLLRVCKGRNPRGYQNTSKQLPSTSLQKNERTLLDIPVENLGTDVFKHYGEHS